MSNAERDPAEIECESGAPTGEVLAPREVPLGGPRAMTVRRTLPQRQRTLIGAWCFVDHYGPDDVSETGGMFVAPHPHIGLQTVSWLFEGAVTHRDSSGNHALVVPGELNLMTAGRGISHSEVSTPDTETLHGAQLWVALPADRRDVEPGFAHYAPPELGEPGWTAKVFLGSLLGSESPVATATPLLGAELRLDEGFVLDLPVEHGFEHGVLVDQGVVSVGDVEGKPGDLVYVPPGAVRLTVAAHEDARVLLLGGPPFGEQIVMWWNFVGRDHAEVVRARADWQAQIAEGTQADGRFGVVAEETLPPIPAPALPNATLRSRG
jgi:redox-sensitive bicupin YhaK (pirin superfamily)